MRPGLAPHARRVAGRLLAPAASSRLEVALREQLPLARLRDQRPEVGGRQHGRRRRSAPPAHSASRTPPGTFSSRTSTRSPSRSYGPAVA